MPLFFVAQFCDAQRYGNLARDRAKIPMGCGFSLKRQATFVLKRGFDG
jgi:hypothetical protein